MSFEFVVRGKVVTFRGRIFVFDSFMRAFVMKSLVTVLLLSCLSSYSQEQLNNDDSTEIVPYQLVDEPAFYPGGLDSLYKSLKVIYPQTAIRDSIQGRVFVQFVVEEDGSLTDFKVIKGLCTECDMAALDGVRKLAMRKWVPGKVDGIPVRQLCIIPINFNIVNID